MILRRVTLLDPVRAGASVSVFIQVTLEKQTEPVLDAFEVAMASFQEVMECYLMTGNSDYLLRVVVSRHRRPAALHRRPAIQDPRCGQHPLQLRAETGEVQNRASDQ